MIWGIFSYEIEVVFRGRGIKRKICFIFLGGFLEGVSFLVGRICRIG